jgi:dTDP-4-amino-4,6-dideoxygalactose transaminase
MAIGVASGTDALILSLLACGVGAGDEVIAPSHTAVATIAAIELTGARPVLVDIDLTRYTLDPEQVSHAITERTRAIIPVHLYGCPADMNPILEMAAKKKITVIEDASQAHGASISGRRVGSLSEMRRLVFTPLRILALLVMEVLLLPITRTWQRKFSFCGSMDGSNATSVR